MLKGKVHSSFYDEIVQNSLIELSYLLTEHGLNRLSYNILDQLGDSRGNKKVLVAMNTIYFIN